jgi:hypothetical protein
VEINILKRQFGYTRTRYGSLMKNTAQITTLLALSNLWMARKALLGAWKLREATTRASEDTLPGSNARGSPDVPNAVG